MTENFNFMSAWNEERHERKEVVCYCRGYKQRVPSTCSVLLSSSMAGGTVLEFFIPMNPPTCPSRLSFWIHSARPCTGLLMMVNHKDANRLASWSAWYLNFYPNQSADAPFSSLFGFFIPPRFAPAYSS
jgi:hypothetical protein